MKTSSLYALNSSARQMLSIGMKLNNFKKIYILKRKIIF